MLTIVAAALSDGWAFVSDGGGIRLVRPPYTLSSTASAPETAVQKAVAQYGFEAGGQSFGTWNELISFLRDRMVQAYRELGLPVPRQGVGGEVVRHLPLRLLNKYLDRIQSDLLPRGEFDAAEAVLADVLRNQAVRESAAALGRALDLMLEARESRVRRLQRREELAQELTTERVAAAFPLTVERYSAASIEELSESIAKGGHILAPA